MYRSLINGDILIATGIAARNHPDLIAGYIHTTPKKNIVNGVLNAFCVVHYI